MTAILYIDRNDKEDTEVIVEADYRPATPDRLWPWPGSPGESEEINITSVTSLEGVLYDLTHEETLKAEQAIREAAEVAAREVYESTADIDFDE